MQRNSIHQFSKKENKEGEETRLKRKVREEVSVGTQAWISDRLGNVTRLSGAREQQKGKVSLMPPTATQAKYFEPAMGPQDCQRSSIKTWHHEVRCLVMETCRG